MTDTDTSKDARELLDRTIEAIKDKTFTLAYIAQGDQLTDQQLQGLLDGKNVYDDPQFEEYESEARYSGFESEYKELLDDDERELLDQHPDLVDELRWAIEERDTSNLGGQLLTHSPSKLLRFNLGYDVNGMEYASDEEYEQELAGIAAAAGVDLEANRSEIVSMLAESSYGGNLQILWYGDVEEVVTALEGKAAAKATFTNPKVVILDLLNGSGMDGELKGEVSVTFKDGDVRIDSLSRYGWTQVACPVESYYSTPVTFGPADA